MNSSEQKITKTHVVKKLLELECKVWNTVIAHGKSKEWCAFNFTFIYINICILLHLLFVILRFLSFKKCQ